MANIVSVERLSKAYLERPVLSDITFGIDEGDRVGIIGVNGSGKSTLLGCLAGVIEPDAGRVVRANHVRVAMLSQTPDFGDSATVGDVAAAGRETLAYLHKLGLDDPGRLLDELSGGERRRAALAEVLGSEAELTILDEPTNHLDVDVIDWLEDRLAERRGALVVVTHDRYLLDRVATRVFEVVERGLVSHRGTYQDFLVARATREALAAASERKRRNLARTELEWLRRSPKARTGKSKARIDAARELLAREPRPERVSMEFDFPTRRLGSKVVVLDDAAVSYDGVPILSDVTWALDRRARVGIVGPNGAGKTTLLRLLAGLLEPVHGVVDRGDTVEIGWFGQDPRPLDESRRILDVIRDVADQTRLASGTSVSAGELLQRFGFPARTHSMAVGDLSGGERRRIELLLVLAGVPNLLLLDEPTNDLDLDTLGVFEEFLDGWEGALVAASHDRYFLERVCSDIVSIEPDHTIRHHPGGWVAYRAWKAASTMSPPGEGSGPGEAKTPRLPRRNPARSEARLSYKESRELETLDDLIRSLESGIAAVGEELERAAGDWEAAASLGEQLADLHRRLERAEDRWLELSERA